MTSCRLGLFVCAAATAQKLIEAAAFLQTATRMLNLPIPHGEKSSTESNNARGNNSTDLALLLCCYDRMQVSSNHTVAIEMLNCIKKVS